MKSDFLNLLKSGWYESLAVEPTYFAHNVSYLNLEGEVLGLELEKL